MRDDSLVKKREPRRVQEQREFDCCLHRRICSACCWVSIWSRDKCPATKYALESCQTWAQIDAVAGNALKDGQPPYPFLANGEQLAATSHTAAKSSVVAPIWGHMDLHNLAFAYCCHRSFEALLLHVWQKKEGKVHITHIEPNDHVLHL